jgi:uncharacterized membrane protein HdeD (DUF308 family)
MVIVTGIIAVPAALAVRRVRKARRWLTLASGVASVVLGLLLANELTNRHDGLFSETPAWIPR